MITTLATTAAILAFLWNISGEIGDIKSDIGELRGMVKANNQSISELRGDVREIRTNANFHLETHTRQAMVEKNGDSKTEAQ